MPRNVMLLPFDRRIDGPNGESLLIEYFRPAKSFFSTDKRVPPERGGTHARVTEQDVAGNVVAQSIIEVSGADAYLCDLRARWAAAAQSEPRPAIASRCSYCDVAREHRGRHGFIERLSVGFDLSLDSRRAEFDVYACSRCGSIEFFDPR